jgi:hypothetical protein
MLSDMPVDGEASHGLDDPLRLRFAQARWSGPNPMDVHNSRHGYGQEVCQVRPLHDRKTRLIRSTL